MKREGGKIMSITTARFIAAEIVKALADLR
jgi:hypothetical protein